MDDLNSLEMVPFVGTDAQYLPDVPGFILMGAGLLDLEHFVPFYWGSSSAWIRIHFGRPDPVTHKSGEISSLKCWMFAFEG
jgi:hypothetical protein